MQNGPGNPGGQFEGQPPFRPQSSPHWQQGPPPGNRPYPGQPMQGQWGAQNYGYPPPQKKTGFIVALALGLVVLIGLGVGGFFLFKSNANPGANTPLASTDLATTQKEVEVNPLAKLMDRIRKSNTCDMFDEQAIQKYGPSHDIGVVNSLGSCVTRAFTAADADHLDLTKPSIVFELRPGERYTARQKAKDTPEKFGDHQVYRGNLSDSDEKSTCYYYLLYPGVADYAAELTAQLTPPTGQPHTEWPERCEVTKEYLGVIAEKILQMAPAATPREQPSLTERDPCLKKDEAAAQVIDWKVKSVIQNNPHDCVIDLSNPRENYTQTLKIEFERLEEQVGGENITLAGLTGQRFVNTASCSVGLQFRPPPPGNKKDGRYISIMLNAGIRPPEDQTPVPAPSCDVVDKIAEIVVDGVR